MNIRANVTLTLQITVKGENWNEHTSSEQLLREAGEIAVKLIGDKVERYAAIVGKPKVDAVITSTEPRR